ncbi:uncharacterized protein [Nicotiana tomentosiformis]|uniref:uncharacterized protein n=1 Tax=Nicotiana tomentosiformis TaxID=4098 RepID=UPI00388CABAC
MTVTQYETQFMDLARHAIILLLTERERVRRFIDGLTFTIRLQMDKETGDDITFQRAVDIARWIEMVRGQERGPMSDKRPRHSSGFGGALSGGRGTFGRGHPPRPFQLALQASHSALGSHGPYVSHSGQPSYSAPSTVISVPPIQSCHRGYSARSGQLQLHQPQQQDGCFECGGTGHIRRLCPRLLNGILHQSSRAMVSAPVASPLAQPARGRGKAARGGGQAIKGEGQAIRGGGRPIDVGQISGAHP